jgi:putative phosphoribosyl transferase
MWSDGTRHGTASTIEKGTAMVFHDRFDAGRRLGERLSPYRDRADVVVFALPRGGVPVGFEIAKSLNAPLDVFLARKLGLPGHEELAMGAVANGGVEVLNEDVVQQLHIPRDVIESVARRERRRIEEQRAAYRDAEPPLDVEDKVVILVDDGLATGSTMRAAIAALHQQRPKRLIVAVPVGAPETCAELRDTVDELVCEVSPQPFYAVGAWYDDFSPTSDETVRALLAEAAHGQHAKSDTS